MRDALGEDPAGQFADGFLLFAVGEIHVSLALSVGLAGPRHAEAEDGDEVALDLVGAAAEGQDDDGAGVHLEPAGEDRSGRAPGEIAGLADEFPSGHGTARR